MNHWWANQSVRYRVEREGGHVFAPLPDSSTRYQEGWENLRYLKLGDIIVHNKGSRIRAVSRVIGHPEECRRPTLPDETEAEKSVAGYRSMGTRVDVEYFDLKSPIKVNEIPEAWRTSRAGPFSDAPSIMGRPEQIYLAKITSSFFERLQQEFSDRWPELPSV
jgi:hypothetical protein